MNEIAKFLSFATILQNAAALDLSDTENILIIGSTIIARNDFVARLKDFLQSSTQPQWECISLAHTHSQLPSEADPSYFSDPKIYEQEPMSTINSGALLLKLSFVRKIIKTLIPFRDPLDYELIFQTLLHKAKAYYMYPPILEYRHNDVFR
jgi:hypothetical protein